MKAKNDLVYYGVPLLLILCMVAITYLEFFYEEEASIGLYEIYDILNTECLDACIDLRDNPRNYYERIYRYNDQIYAYKVHVNYGDANPLNDECWCRLNVDSLLAFDEEYRLDTDFEGLLNQDDVVATGANLTVYFEGSPNLYGDYPK